jgi:hypothetical protein
MTTIIEREHGRPYRAQARRAPVERSLDVSGSAEWVSARDEVARIVSLAGRSHRPHLRRGGRPRVLSGTEQKRPLSMGICAETRILRCSRFATPRAASARFGRGRGGDVRGERLARAEEQ